MERYQFSHALGLQDALVAATAQAKGWTLLSGNAKHFKMIEGLDLEKFKYASK